MAKPRPTNAGPSAYCAALPTVRRRLEGAAPLQIFDEVTDSPTVMWGLSMIGYGETPATGGAAES